MGKEEIMTVNEARALMADKGSSYSRGPADPRTRARMSAREWRKRWGQAKAVLAAEAVEVLEAIGRFPPGAGEPSAHHRPRRKK